MIMDRKVDRQIKMPFMGPDSDPVIPAKPKRERQVTIGEFLDNMAETVKSTEKEIAASKGPEPKTLEEARREMMSQIDEGTECPCCGRHNQRYKNNLTAEIVASLCWLVEYHCRGRDNKEWYPGIEFVDVAAKAPRFVLKFRKVSKLAYWGLVEGDEKRSEEEEIKKTSGRWRATRAGFDFVNKKITVAKFVLVLNSVVQSHSDEQVGILEAMRSKFSYDKLMRGES